MIESHTKHHNPDEKNRKVPDMVEIEYTQVLKPIPDPIEITVEMLPVDPNRPKQVEVPVNISEKPKPEPKEIEAVEKPVQKNNFNNNLIPEKMRTFKFDYTGVKTLADFINAYHKHIETIKSFNRENIWKENPTVSTHYNELMVQLKEQTIAFLEAQNEK